MNNEFECIENKTYIINDCDDCSERQIEVDNITLRKITDKTHSQLSKKFENNTTDGPCDLYRVEIKTPRLGTLYIFLDKTIEEVEALKFGFKNETDLKLLISKQK